MYLLLLFLKHLQRQSQCSLWVR